MITQKELEEMRIYAINSSTSRSAHYILTLLNELERVNRLGTEVREVNLKFMDGTEENIWPVRDKK